MSNPDREFRPLEKVPLVLAPMGLFGNAPIARLGVGSAINKNKFFWFNSGSATTTGWRVKLGDLRGWFVKINANNSMDVKNPHGVVRTISQGTAPTYANWFRFLSRGRLRVAWTSGDMTFINPSQGNGTTEYGFNLA